MGKSEEQIQQEMNEQYEKMYQNVEESKNDKPQIKPGQVDLPG